MLLNDLEAVSAPRGVIRKEFRLCHKYRVLQFSRSGPREMDSTRHIISLLKTVCIVAALALLVLSCGQPGQSGESTAALTNHPRPPTPRPLGSRRRPRPTAESPYRSVPSGGTYDPNRTMYRIWDGLGHDRSESLAGLEDAVFYDDKSQAYVILEALKFSTWTSPGALWIRLPTYRRGFRLRPAAGESLPERGRRSTRRRRITVGGR